MPPNLKLAILGMAGFAASAAPSAWDLPAIFLANSSPSAPKGLYILEPASAIKRGDRVAALPPIWARELAAERGYLARETPVIKIVWAVPGDRFCMRAGVLSVEKRPDIKARTHDGMRRKMPVWTGCGTLGQDRYLLISTDVATSFDSRYFGPVRGQSIVGRVTLIWRFGDG